MVRKKREDAKKIQNAIARSEQEEKTLERNLAKEKAKLDKVELWFDFELYLYFYLIQVLTHREDNYSRLVRQRAQMQESKALLKTHEREHERLLRVQVESQSLQSLTTI